jgi:hypothetical protein
VEENGDLGVRAVAALGAAWAHRGQKLTVGHFRVLRSLITPAARAAVLPLLLPKEGEMVSVRELEREVQRVTHNTWVDFHWSEENPLIEPTIRMTPVTLALCCRLPPPCLLGLSVVAS